MIEKVKNVLKKGTNEEIENLKKEILDCDKTQIIDIFDELYDYEEDIDLDKKKNQVFMEFFRDKRFTKKLKEIHSDLKKLNENESSGGYTFLA